MAELKPANENPWYVLSTLHGEYVDGYDPELAAKNIRLWNIWSCQNLTDAAREVLREKGAEVPDASEWEAHRAEIETLYVAAMEERNGSGFLVPDIPATASIIDIRKTTFALTVVWEKAVFMRETSFASANFSQGAFFSSTIFAKDVSFAYAIFNHDASFSSANFTEAASFNSANFMQSTSFVFAIFEQRALFDTASFAKDTFFASATFEGRAVFNSVTFSEAADFDSVIFSWDALFGSATFSQRADFDAATFNQRAFFGSADFKQFASFVSATFKQRAFFDSAVFTQYVDFDSAIFEGVARFVETRFGLPEKNSGAPLPADFSDAVFNKPTNFRRAVFKGRYPLLAGTVFHANTQITAQKANWPTGYQNPANSPEAKDACATLRHIVAKQGLPEDEYFFFRNEMKFSGQTCPVLAMPIYLFYGLISDYGYSVWRPVIGLLLLWVLGFVFFQGCGTSDLFCVVDPPTARLLSSADSAGFSGSNMFKFFGFQRTYFTEELELIETQRSGLLNLAAAQTVLGYILLFFLGLGLRARFRLR